MKLEMQMALLYLRWGYVVGALACLCLQALCGEWLVWRVEPRSPGKSPGPEQDQAGDNGGPVLSNGKSHLNLGLCLACESSLDKSQCHRASPCSRVEALELLASSWELMGTVVLAFQTPCPGQSKDIPEILRHAAAVGGVAGQKRAG